MSYQKQNLDVIVNITQIVTVHYFELSKDFNYPQEKHNFWELHYTDKGTALTYVDDKEFLLEQGDIFFHKPNETHRLKTNGQSSANVCVISFVCNSAALKFFEEKKLKLTSQHRILLRQILDEANASFAIPINNPELKKLVKRTIIPIGGLQMLKARLEEFLITLLRDFSSAPIKLKSFIFSYEYEDSLVNKIIAYMQNNITEKFSLDKICNVFYYSKTYLCKKFFAVTGKTMNTFFLEMKIEIAKQLIRERSSSSHLLTQISNSLNFSSPAFFYYTFKKITNMTPTEYAKSVKQYDYNE